MQSFRFLPFVCSPRVGVKFPNRRFIWMGVSKGGGYSPTGGKRVDASRQFEMERCVSILPQEDAETRRPNLFVFRQLKKIIFVSRFRIDPALHCMIGLRSREGVACEYFNTNNFVDPGSQNQLYLKVVESKGWLSKFTPMDGE